MTQRIANLIACCALLFLLGFSAFAYLRRVDERASARYDQALRSLLALDFRLTAEVMKARAGVVGHYDGIVQTVAARRRLWRTLAELPDGVWSGDQKAAIIARLARGEHQRRQTEDLVERLKRENAVLRNSVRFLPVLAEELESARVPGSQPLSYAGVGQLVRDELLLQSWPDSALIDRMDRALAGLLSLDMAPGAHGQGLATLLTHARVVRERTPLVQELTRKIVAAEDARWTEDLLTAFLARHRAAQEVTDFDARVCFGLALTFFAAFFASIILAQQRAATALRSTSDQLAQAVDSLRIEQAKQQELSELKSRFVAMASHEFRTPLSIIVSSSELLEAYGERWPASKKREHFTRIQQAASGMTRMLDDILTIGQRHAGLLHFEPRSLPIAGFCAEVVAAIGAASGQRDRIVYSAPSAAERVMADPVLLRHVLENLLSNALKYSPAGEPVELHVVREEEALRFSVSDQGIGISEEDQLRLFETFHRGKNVGEISGTGLGLAIVQGAVELHGGNVTVQSRLGVGTEFTVRIPLLLAGGLAGGPARFDSQESAS